MLEQKLHFRYIRIQTPEHAIIESHPDNVLTDLRLDAPFPALAAYMESVDLESESVSALHEIISSPCEGLKKCTEFIDQTGDV